MTTMECNLRCTDCGAKYYSAAPMDREDDPCERCGGMVEVTPRPEQESTTC